MKLDITGIRIETTEAINQFIEKKTKKLDKFFDDATICHITFTDRSRGKHKLDLRIEYKSKTYLAQEETDDLYSGIEQLVSKIEGQLRKDKAMIDKARKEGIPVTEEAVEETLTDDE